MDASGRRQRFSRPLATDQSGVHESLPAAVRAPAKLRKSERGIWQRGHWEHTVRDERDYAAHMDYIRFNPVKHVLAESPADWPFSSFRQCAAAGLYPVDWLAAAEPVATGER